MSVIIRLQGLPWSASAMNIRHFFTGLNIPAGGVHIIGGEGGDAFIAFSSDDDARMAMKKNLCPLNGTTVQLFLSSKSEMQSVIDAARSGSSAAAPTPAVPVATIPQNILQPPQRQQFSNMPNMFPVENQNQNNTSNSMAGQVGDFNQQMQNQFVKNDWQGFQMYGGRMDEQNQQMTNQFQHNQRLSGNQIEGRFPNILGGNDRAHFAVPQQDKSFPLGGPPFYDGSNQMQPTVASAGIGGMHQGADMSALGGPVTQKQPSFGENVVARPGAIPVPPIGGDSPAGLMPNMAAMGRGQIPFPGQVNIGPNRNMFNANMGRPLLGKDMAANIPGNLPGSRVPGNDGILGRGNTTEDKSLGESMDDMGQTEKFSNQFANELGQGGGSDGRKSEMMDWGVDDSPDTRFMGSQKPFDQDAQADKPNLNREKMGLDSRSFQQFPFRNDPDRARINRVLEVVERSDPTIDADESRHMERLDREPSFPGREPPFPGREPPFPGRELPFPGREPPFPGREPPFPGRDIRTGSRFAPAQEQEGRFNSDKFTDRSVDRFNNDRIPPEESLPSTKYPPEPETQVGPVESRPPGGRFPPIRGRNDEIRYPPDERPFPPDHRFPNEDRRMPNREPTFPPEHERFPEEDINFPPTNRGYLPDDRRHAGDNRRFPPPPESNRFHPEEGRFPPDDRTDLHPDRMRSEEFGGRRPGDNPFAPDDIRFREREEELRRRDGFGRGRRGLDDRFPHDRPGEGRPNIRPGFRNFEEGDDLRRFPPDRRFPPERPKWNEEEDEEEFRGPPRGLDERRGGMSRWDRDRVDDWQEDNDRFPPAAGPRGRLPDDADFPGIGRPGNMDIDGPADMDQRTGRDLMNMRGPPDGRRGPAFEGRGGPGIEGVGIFPDPDGMRGLGGDDRRPGMEGFRASLIEGRGHPIEGLRGRGMEGMRGRGMEGMRGRGAPGMDGRRGGPGISNMADENSFDYGHGSVGRGRPPLADDEFGETVDFDNRFQGPGERGGMFDRSHRGRGDAFFNRGRPGPPLGRGRGLDVDRRFEEAPPESRFNMDVDARNVGGRPDGPPIRPALGDVKLPDFSVKPGSGKGLLGDAPALDRPTVPKPEPEKKDIPVDSARRDVDNRSADNRSARRSSERDRDHRPTDRRGRDREDRRSGERDRSRYRYERDRSDRRRSRSRERGGRDNDGRRSRDRSSSTKKDHEGAKGEPRKRSIHIRNIPAMVTYKDVRRFLQPIDVPFDGMKIINDKQGQRTGDAYVQFRHADDAGRAARRNGEKMNGKIVSISLCTDEEFSAASDSFSQNKKDNPPTITETQKIEKDDKIRYIVQVKNLPLNITKQDIAQFFKGLTIENNGEAIYIEHNQTGVVTGIGFVELKSDYDYKKALTQDGSLLGTIALRVFPGKKEEADELKKKQQEAFQRSPLHNAANSRMMQSQPQGQPPRPQGQPPRPQGQPPRPQPPRAQAQLPRPQGQPPRPGLIGPRHGMGPQAPSPTSQPAPANNQTARASTPSENTDTVCVHIQGLPLLATPQDIREFFSDCQIALRGINIAHDSRGKPLGEGFVEFKFKSDFEKAIKKDKTSLGRHIVAVKPIGKKEMIERLDNARGLPAQQGSQQTPEEQTKNQGIPQASEKQQNSSQNSSQSPQQGQVPPGQNPQGQKPLLSGPGGPGPISAAPTPGVTVTASGSKSIPAGVLNKNWYYVRCQNFPPDISIAEILTFFQGFRPIGESIRLHYSSDGKPTGNAVVGFLSPEEAQRALQRLSMKVCRQNIVTLHPA